ncbi:MAG TPA: TIGR01777 family oxidoreductase [Planctomycetota bacterium]|nr:TIGR01777 family oxidoreductase [Planctomycetota bacterium]
MRLAVTGARGFVGQQLVHVARARGWEVLRLSRGPDGDRRWDPMKEPAPLDDVDAVIHLAGESLLGGRWTRAKMNRIRNSRSVGTRNLVLGLRSSPARVLVAASAVGYYGDRGEEELTEESGPGEDFLSRVCIDGEREALASGIRTVILRTGTVLGPGGALRKMLGPFRLGLGGKLGSGRQWMSWIHRADLIDLYLHALSHSDLSGPVLATSPMPVRNQAFTRLLARTVARPALLRIPTWALRLAYGKVASVLLSSQKCLPLRAVNSGFRFRYPTLDGALWEAVATLLTRVERAA